MNEYKKTLGILGGLGPMSSVYFYRLITEHTKASCDQEHIDVVLLSGASIPDRTEFITGKSKVSPMPAMKAGIHKLCTAGAEIIAIPCNTAHYFYSEISKDSPVPVLNIIEETVKQAKKVGAKKLGIMATDGTVKSGSYQKVCEEHGMDYVIPSEKSQAALMDIIYGSVKCAKAPDTDKFRAVAHELCDAGCDMLILGCTELSLLDAPKICPECRFMDSLLVLAKVSIEKCGAIPFGFEEIYN